MKASFVSFRIIITKYVEGYIKCKTNKQNFLKQGKPEKLKQQGKKKEKIKRKNIYKKLTHSIYKHVFWFMIFFFIFERLKLYFIMREAKYSVYI